MKRDENLELKSKDELKKVSEKSKQKKTKHKKANTLVNDSKDLITEKLIPSLQDDLVKIGTKDSSATADESVKSKKKKKPKKHKKDSHASATKVESKELNLTNGKNQDQSSENLLSKIERKKAKKLAQKLKKKQKREQHKDEASTQDRNDKPKKHKKQKVQTDKAQKSSTSEGAAVSKDLGEKTLKAKAKKEKKEKEPKEQRPRDPAVDAATVFVGNLPVNTKRVQLVRLFQKYSTINSIRLRTASGKTIYKHKQRKEAGALNAYVVLSSVQAVEKALELNGTEFKGNHLRVTHADRNAHNRDHADVKRTIFVGNLKYTANEEKLREIFSSCGEIEYVRCLRDGDKGCKGVAYVCFKAPEAVTLAIELNETMLDERPIHVERYSVKKLGAKQARDEASFKEKQKQTGAKRRLDNKKQPKQGQVPTADHENHKKKKGEFRGVKVDGVKKNKQKKKKSPGQLVALAKKIAPRPSN